MAATQYSTITHTPTSILKRFYHHEGIYMTHPTRSNLQSLLPTISPQVLLTQTPSLPYGGTFMGHEGFQSWTTQMSEHFSTVDVQNPVLFTNDSSNKIIVNAELRLVVRSTEKELRYPMCQVLAFDVVKGVITEIMPFYWDVAGLKEALAEGKQQESADAKN